ncbi:type II CAAX endopeptidase family protein [Pontiellaceae bacterium B12227]|nr:type II CAAX endopeptidase family protein [Pontiellaceae bacterium B12227]
MDTIEPATVPEEPVDAVAAEEPVTPFSVKATLGYSIVVGIISVVVQVLFIIVWAVVDGLINDSLSGMAFAENGNCLLGSVLFSYPFIVGATYLIIRSRRGLDFLSYIGWYGWRTMKGKALVPWFAVLIGSMLINGLLMHLTGATSSEMMGKLLESTNPVLVIVMMVFGAPLIEELFFRGFMFKGLQHSKVGGAGAVVITTVIWALIHGGQYNLAEVSYLMVLGGLFGYARLKTNALCLPLALHVVNNLIAVIPALVWGMD